MKKVIIIISAVLVLIGAVLIGVAFAVGDLSLVNRARSVTHEADGAFEDISVEVSFADVHIRRSSTDKCYAVCDETEKLGYTLTVTDGTLTLRERDTRRWFEYIEIHTDMRGVVLYLPEGEYGSLSVTAASGDVECRSDALVFGDVSIKNASGETDLSARVTGALNVESASGDIEIEGMAPDSLKLSAASGEISLEGVRAASLMEITTSSGDISLEGCDAGELLLTSASGEIEATLLSDKLFEADSKSGRIRIPPSVRDGGICKAKTSSGDIEIRVMG